MNELKVDPKLVADQLGHTLDVNQNVYTLPNRARRQEAVNMLETAIKSRVVVIRNQRDLKTRRTNAVIRMARNEIMAILARCRGKGTAGSKKAQ
jgi:hypothetical protein